ncbi:hypothetical protein SAMN04489806_1467 [Paramicrobacterium humi]|uniref:Uncharacterized protein n=1 Tax=Paramicrobacterium humi TaxID=640635 RepID=A0A1H4LA42_9MICO|nr:hypothetical protein [Microbacterium humi]SEB67308.1 hypothetical protein SAMN04489806_1467 [Microbacterium humi]
MPAQKSYSQDYIGGCRERLWAQIALYDEADADAVLESVFFNNLVIVLEATFMHRDRDQEGTNGNALGEVRVLAASLMDDGVTMGADPSTGLDAETSVLGLAPGDEIALTEDDFVQLADAFFSELERRYGEA